MVSNSNFETLKDAGLISGTGNLPEPYYEVIMGLTDDEIAVLMSVKDRLERASDDVKGEHDWAFMVPF